MYIHGLIHTLKKWRICMKDVTWYFCNGLKKKIYLSLKPQCRRIKESSHVHQQNHRWLIKMIKKYKHKKWIKMMELIWDNM